MILKYPSLSSKSLNVVPRLKSEDKCDIVLTLLIPNLEIKVP